MQRIPLMPITHAKIIRMTRRLPILLCLAAAWAALSIPSSFAAQVAASRGAHGMVTSTSRLGNAAAIEVMKSGGNAVDAAVTLGFALAVTYPEAGNVGGGGFAVLRLPSGEVVTLDHRERAPRAATRDMFLDADGQAVAERSLNSHLASGVPGTVDGLLALHDRYGSLPLKQLLAPAIEMARQGVLIEPEQVDRFNDLATRTSHWPATQQKFTQAGQPFVQGDIWKQPHLANTLQTIAEKGRSGFYEGWVAQAIADEMTQGGGLISLEDLRDYQSIWRAPIHTVYRGFDVWSMGPPSSGGVLIAQILHMLEPHDLSSMGWGSARLAHLVVEAERRAYADRAEHLGDPDFWPVPVATLTDPEYARARMRDFDPERASLSLEIGAGQGLVESENTTHYGLIDKNGLMVAITTTLNSSFGSELVIPETGVLMNNEMDDFSAQPGVPNQFGLLGAEANAIEPEKRMLSSMTPTLVTRNGEPFLITGSPGGSTIITTVLQVLMNVIDHKMPLAEAVGLPRFHHQWFPDAIQFGPRALSPDTLDLLQAKGHKLAPRSEIGDANSILIKDGTYWGVKDPREFGSALGY